MGANTLDRFKSPRNSTGHVHEGGDGGHQRRSRLRGRHLSRWEVTDVCSNLVADVGHVHMDLIEKVGGPLHLRGEVGVLLDQLLDVIGIAFGMDSNLRGDGVRPLGGNQKGRRLNSSKHREEKVEENIWVRVEGLLLAQDMLQDECIENSPGDHDAEKCEHKRPGPHHVAHPVGRSLAQGELIPGPYGRMLVPEGLRRRRCYPMIVARVRRSDADYTS